MVDVDNILALPSMTKEEDSGSSPLTTESEGDEGVLGSIAALDNDENDATISTLAMRDSTGSCCFWRPRRQPWKTWLRRPSAMQLPMVALGSNSGDSVASQESHDNTGINKGSSLLNSINTAGRSPTSAARTRVKNVNHVTGSQPTDANEGKHPTEEVEGVSEIHDDDNDECVWHEWTIPLNAPAQTNDERSPRTENKWPHVGCQDFRVPLLVANDGDLVFYENDDDECDLESIHLLHDSGYVSSSCLSPSKNKGKHLSNVVYVGDNSNQGYMNNMAFGLSSRPRRHQEDDDKVALLSEHDRVGEERHGSYDVDRVDENSVAGGPSALLSLFTLEQNWREREQAIRRNNIGYPSQKRRPFFVVLPYDNDDQDNGAPIHKDIIQVLGLSAPHADDAPGSAPVQSGYDDHASDERTSLWSVELQSQLSKQNAYHQEKYGDQQRSPNNMLEATHGVLWTLPELPSEDERTSSSLTTITTKSTASRHPQQQQYQQHEQQQQQQQLGRTRNLTSLQPQSQSSPFFNELSILQHTRHQHNYTRSHNISSLTRQAESQSLLGTPPSQPQSQDEECLLDKHSHGSQSQQAPPQNQLRKLDMV
jgi:hypothetical protein